jgi:UDP-N-acetylglucosamine 4,6-dehydratase
MFNNKVIFLTGGTGSFGKKFIEMVCVNYNPTQIIVYSRDELKQYEMMQWVSKKQFPVSFKLGDVRDVERLRRCMFGSNYVIHAAALKHVPAAEDNPFEFIKTNVLGAQNVIEASLDCGIEKVIALSTDKACNPINLYGATKLAADKLFVAAGTRHHSTKFGVVRYGNVIGSRGSVIPFFMNQISKGVIPITDERMTRFLITLEQGVKLVFSALELLNGGEIYIPKIPSMNIIDLADIVAPGVPKKIIGIRPGEKLHEVMISEDDARLTIERDNSFVVYSASKMPKNLEDYKIVKDQFRYASDTNPHFMTKDELHNLLKNFELRGHELIYRNANV